MEHTIHITTGRWLFTSDRRLARCLLLLLVVLISGCNQPQSVVTREITSSPMATPAQGFPTATVPLAPVFTDSISPTWSKVELPPGCNFHSLSPNLKWVAIQGCRSEKGNTNWIAQVDENGRLHNSKQIEGRLLHYYDGTGVMGFTLDSTRLIVERDKVFWFINLADLAQQPYASDTAGTSGVGNFGTERWSPDGRLYLGSGCLGCDQIVVVSPNDRIENIAVDGIGRHGAQYTWSANGEEIAYVEGDYQEGMKARLINLQTGKNHTLIESQFPAGLTGASYSPNGERISVREQNMDSSEAILWLVDPKTESKIRLVYDLSGVEVYDGWRDMVWSPDGSNLALRGSSDDSEGFVVIEIPSGEIVYRGTKETTGNPLAWSADGKSLLVLDFHEEANSAIGNYILRWVQIQ
ncbi:hypothetical protein ANRL4_03615 [Anaerolineae bacterium]|nr:hypothetical protein ANRL4_03615 [Anaerolineae bacterium]